MTLDKILKANDGRGKGHLGRVLNFISRELVSNSLGLIADRRFSAALPDEVWSMLTRDGGWRVNLDSETVEQKWRPAGLEELDPAEAVRAYYFCLGRVLNLETRLVYIDDQNAPETLFLKRIGQVVGEAVPDIWDIAPNARTAFEIETQIWSRSGAEAMGRTREECFQRADYLHLSSDADFFKAVVGDYDFAGQNHKVIPMGFPLSLEVRRILTEAGSRKEAFVRELYEKHLGIPDGGTRRLVYCNFGAGEGADEVIGALVEAAADFAGECIFVIDNFMGTPERYAKTRYDVVPNREKLSKISVGSGHFVYLTDAGFPFEKHLMAIAAADVLIQGNGSGTTYEGIAARTPIITVPLDRPAWEQLIKGLGVEKLGVGEMLLVESAMDKVDGLTELIRAGGHDLSVEKRALNAANLGAALARILDNPGQYRDAAGNVQDDFFCDPSTTARVLDDMADGYPAEEIIARQGLKTF